MNTPVYDFLCRYREKDPVRLHMPGHKGVPRLGCEPLDLTEIPGADSLFEAEGILLESEENATRLFGAGKTLYSTEGSSLAVRAMVFLAATRRPAGRRGRILAARNVHRSFLCAVALCDLDVSWLTPASTSLCACPLTPAVVENALSAMDEPPVALYLTSPDYLGNLQPVREIAVVCHRHGVPLLVDNAHGAYLRFLPRDLHPLTAGADLCCDSAHKTLPVLTGGAYLHIGQNAPAGFADRAREALSLFASSSPSYLILASLDLCNRTLAEDFRDRLAAAVRAAEHTRQTLRENGWMTVGDEPMKLTLAAPPGLTGQALSARLAESGIVAEHADRDFLVLMPAADTPAADLQKLCAVLGKNTAPYTPAAPGSAAPAGAPVFAPSDCAGAPVSDLSDSAASISAAPSGTPVSAPYTPAGATVASGGTPFALPAPEIVVTVREALFAPREVLPIEDAVGRICVDPALSCPPAIPVVLPGERIRAAHLPLLRHYQKTRIAVML